MVGFQITSQDIVVYIADRGQGIIETLSKALPQPNKPSEILRKAFEERVTGRAPEKRGNGLKFVNLHIQKNQNSLVCYTQNEIYFINEEFIKILPSNLPKEFGTLICIKWRINESQNQ